MLYPMPNEELAAGDVVRVAMPDRYLMRTPPPGLLLKLQLGMPVSVNRMYENAQRRGKGGGTFTGKMLSDEAKHYRDTVFYAARQAKVYKALEGRLAIDVLAQPANLQSFDLDNRWKCLLDSLIYARVIVDDRQFDHLRMTRGPVTSPACVHVKISRFDPDGALADWADIMPAGLFDGQAKAA